MYCTPNREASRHSADVRLPNEKLYESVFARMQAALMREAGPSDPDHSVAVLPSVPSSASTPDKHLLALMIVFCCI